MEVQEIVDPLLMDGTQLINEANNESSKIIIIEDKTITENIDTIAKIIPAPTTINFCSCNCRFQCTDISIERMEQIKSSFRNFDFGEKRIFLDHCITTCKIKRKTMNSISNRQHIINYSLNNGVKDLRVCKKTFLNALGTKSSNIITSHLNSKKKNNNMVDIKDNRGKSANVKKIREKYETDRIIESHIESFHPVVSHYKLAHSPNRRYLTPDLNIRTLYNDFKVTHPLCTYEKYRKVFGIMNIGFIPPRKDECSKCSANKIHLEYVNQNISDAFEENDENHDENDCVDCFTFKTHHKNYIDARNAYTKDKNCNWPDDTSIFYVDMQKILILPKMELKNSFFISRLICFNEIFSTLKKQSKDICMLWHEAISGRKASDVASTFINLIKKEESCVKKFIFWADNCAGQNKNYILFTALCNVANQLWSPDEITLKYLEVGHTFMSADSVHGLIGKKWKTTPSIFNFDDLINLIGKSGRNIRPIEMKFDEFYEFKNQSKINTLKFKKPLLETIKVVHFKKGDKNMYYKVSHEDNEYQSCNLFSKSFKPEIFPNRKSSPRGINELKKKEIIEKLLCHMEPRSQEFWLNLPTNDQSKDLSTSVDNDF